MCASPRCRHMLTLEIHHIEEVKEGGGSDPHNLLALCPNCHSGFTRGKIPRSAIETWKWRAWDPLERAARDAFEARCPTPKGEVPPYLRPTIAEIVLSGDDAPKHDDHARYDPFYRSEEHETLPPCPSGRAILALIDVGGDGLLRLVRLVTAGLVEPREAHYHDSGARRIVHRWRPRLTDTGMASADAWIAGDADAVRALLRGFTEPQQA